MPENSVVITGLGVVSPNGNNVPEFEQALRRGISGIRAIPELADLKFGCRIGGAPQGFGAALEDRLSPGSIAGLTETMRYAVAAAMEAWADAGFDLPDDATRESAEALWDTGAVIGTGVSDMETIVGRVVPMITNGKVRRMGSRVVEQVMASSVSARICGLLGLGNQVTSNSSACSTGTEAIAEAVWRIRSGRARCMLAGGAEGSSPFSWGGFDAMRVLATRFNDAPEQGSRPMSATACGFVPGSGAGLMLLEERESALKRGARIYAEVAGVHVNAGGQCGGGTMTAPNPDGVRRCIREAIRDAGMTPAHMDAINGHLTATFADPHEIRNWSAALGREADDFPWISSTKSMIGHCLGAAGAIETIAAVLQLSGGFLHPSLNCEDVHPDIAAYADSIVHCTMDFPELSTMAKASFGFGDVNSCLILKKWNPNP